MISLHIWSTRKVKPLPSCNHSLQHSHTFNTGHTAWNTVPTTQVAIFMVIQTPTYLSSMPKPKSGQFPYA
jgi:hypothetical protein